MIDDEPVKLDPDIIAKRQRKEDAEKLLDEGGIFMLAVKSLTRKWRDELMDPALSDRTVDRLRWQLITLRAIPIELTGFITDYKFALDKQKKHG